MNLTDETLDSDFAKECADVGNHGVYLTAFHVYCLANMLRRPIIVYGDEASGDHRMRGVYLPTLFEPQDTYPHPVTVCYTSNPGHFTAVLSPASEAQTDDPSNPLSNIPLSDVHGTPLTVPYGWIDEGTVEYDLAVSLGHTPRPPLVIAPLPHESPNRARAKSKPVPLPAAYRAVYKDTTWSFGSPGDTHSTSPGRSSFGGSPTKRRKVDPSIKIHSPKVPPSEDFKAHYQQVFGDDYDADADPDESYDDDEPGDSELIDYGDLPLVWRYLHYRYAHDGDGVARYPYAERAPYDPALGRVFPHAPFKHAEVWLDKSLHMADEHLDMVKALKIVQEQIEGRYIPPEAGSDLSFANGNEGSNGLDGVNVLNAPSSSSSSSSSQPLWSHVLPARNELARALALAQGRLPPYNALGIADPPTTAPTTAPVNVRASDGINLPSSAPFHLPPHVTMTLPPPLPLSTNPAHPTQPAQNTPSHALPVAHPHPALVAQALTEGQQRRLAHLEEENAKLRAENQQLSDALRKSKDR